MLVKIKPNVFVNTDQVSSVELNITSLLSRDTALIRMAANKQDYSTSPEAAEYLMMQMETANAVILPGEPDYIDLDAPSTQPLTSQIAVLLRDTFPHGATADELMNTLHLDYYLIYAALDNLIAERVIQFDPLNNSARYFHASHTPKEYIAEPEREIGILDATPFIAALRALPSNPMLPIDPIAESRKDLFAFLEAKFPEYITGALGSLKKTEHALKEIIAFLYALKYDCEHLRQLENLLQAIKLVTPNPDPLIEGEAQESCPEEDIGSIVVRTNES